MLRLLSMLHSSEQHVQKKFIAIVLVFCKLATEPVDQVMPKHESIERKIHMLEMLLHLPERADTFFLSTTTNNMVLRCLVVPSLLECCIVGTYHRTYFQQGDSLWRSDLDTISWWKPA
jgi:hypothetical protein